MVKGKPQNFWTTEEINRAAALWAERHTYAQIAQALGRTANSVKHIITRDRDKFPRFNRPQGGNGTQQRQVALKIAVSEFLYKTIKKQAKVKRHSMSYLIQEALREYFLKKDQRVGPAPPRDRNLPASPRNWEVPQAIPHDPFALVLAPGQYRLFKLLHDNVGKFVAVEVIINAFWGHDPNGGPSNPSSLISVTAFHLRKRLNLRKDQLYSRSGLGYILTVEPQLPQPETTNDLQTEH